MAEGGGGYDPCECVFGRERAMQRLLSMISSGQSECTDSTCLTSQGPGSAGQLGDGGSMMMWMMILWLVIAVVLFLMRPKRLRGGKDTDDDWDDHDVGSRHGGGPDNQPPPPEIH